MQDSLPSIELPNKAYILPDAVPMWPPAWWTWVVLGALVTLLLIIIVMLWVRRRRRAYRREALSLLRNTHSMSDQECIIECQHIIRRCLISSQQHSLSALTMTELLPLLDKSMPRQHQFSQLGSWFPNGSYIPDIALSSEQKAQLYKTVSLWIRRHRA